MGPKQEPELGRDFRMPAHEALLNIYHTGSQVRKHDTADSTFRYFTNSVDLCYLDRYHGMGELLKCG